MTPVPREKAAVPALNSFFVDLPRLVEHCQGEFGCGCLVLRGNGVRAQLYFDKEAILNASREEELEILTGDPAVQRILHEGPQAGMEIRVHEIPSESIYLWANVPDAEIVYGDLSTEFTDLGGLILKLGRESLNGYVNICSEGTDRGGVVFLAEGKVVGGSYPPGSAEAASEREKLQLLVAANRDNGATFHVGRFPERANVEPAVAAELPTGGDPGTGAAAVPPTAVDEGFSAIEDLLNAVSERMAGTRLPAGQFRTLLNRKFLEKSETYPFLDPFAAEFTYRGGRVEVDTAVAVERVIRAVVECLQELAREEPALADLPSILAPWSARHDHLMTTWNAGGRPEPGGRGAQG